MEHKYLILDSRGNAVARGISERNATGEIWRLRVDDGDIEQVMDHTLVILVGNTESVPALEGRIIRREGNVIFLEPVRTLKEKVRQNLRIPVRFVSYLYPVSGKWKGRVPIVSKDLSCGGLAFYCPRLLEIGEIVQVVIPVTTQPLLLNLRILRGQDMQADGYFFAGSFLNLVREEESMLCEAVFEIQIENS